MLDVPDTDQIVPAVKKCFQNAVVVVFLIMDSQNSWPSPRNMLRYKYSILKGTSHPVGAEHGPTSFITLNSKKIQKQQSYVALGKNGKRKATSCCTLASSTNQWCKGAEYPRRFLGGNEAEYLSYSSNERIITGHTPCPAKTIHYKYRDTIIRGENARRVQA